MLALLQVGWFAYLNWTLNWRTALLAVSCVLAVVWAWRSSQRPATGALCWDGQQWQWSGFADGACLLQRHLDFQVLMLVYLHRPAERPVWLWLQRAHDPQRWLALRRAVAHSISLGAGHRTGQGTQAGQAAIS